MSESRRLGVVGGGVVGKVLAAHLARAGHEVCLVDVSPDVVEAVGRGGIEVTGPRPVQARVALATGSMARLFEFGPEVVFLCTKTWALREVLQGLNACDDRRAMIACFQNGLDPEEVVAEVFARARVLRGVVNYAGGATDPRTVRLAFFHPPNFIGALDPAGAGTARDLADVLTAAGLKTEFTENIRARAWRKTILNACLMPVSVVTKMTMNQVTGFPATRAIVERLIHEFLAVAAAEGCEFEADFVENAFEYLTNSGGHKPSMLLDFEAKRPIEIEFLNGRIQEHASRLGIPCETNGILLALVGALIHQRDVEQRV